MVFYLICLRLPGNVLDFSGELLEIVTRDRTLKFDLIGQVYSRTRKIINKDNLLDRTVSTKVQAIVK